MCPAAAVVCNYICNKTVFAFVRIAVGIGTLLVALFVPFTGIMDVCNFFMFNFLVDCDGASDTYCWFCRVGPCDPTSSLMHNFNANILPVT